MASRSAAAAAALCAAVVWICVSISAAAAVPAAATAASNANKTSLLAKARLPAALVGGASESQQKQLNPQLLAYFLRPLATYLASLTALAPAPSPALDNWDAAAAPAAQALALPGAPSKLSLLASLFGFGQPAAPADGQNPSYAPGL